jgi:hypothetical protein
VFANVNGSFDGGDYGCCGNGSGACWDGSGSNPSSDPLCGACGGITAAAVGTWY